MSEENVLKFMVNEIFGPTIQGEGKSLNTPVIFLRLSGCNLACHWCDTPYTWNWKGTAFKHPNKFDPKKEVKVLTESQIIKTILELSSDVNRVVISGGEPFLQQKGLTSLIIKLKALDYEVEIETNGTIVPTDEFLAIIDQINCSPKLENSGPDNPVAKRVIPKALWKLAGSRKTYFKFVITSDKDLKEIEAMINTFNMNPKNVYLMPEGRTRQEQIDHQEKVEALCMRYGYNFSPRLHILLHDTKRGV